MEFPYPSIYNHIIIKIHKINLIKSSFDFLTFLLNIAPSYDLEFNLLPSPSSVLQQERLQGDFFDSSYQEENRNFQTKEVCLNKAYIFLKL